MSSSLAELCRAYMGTQLSLPKIPPEQAPPPAITLSRETGAGGVTIARLVADALSAEPDGHPWAVFDRNLVQEILRDHDLPASLQRFVPEGTVPAIQHAIREMFGLHPSAGTLLEYTNETILRLVRAGHVIVVGRGASFVTATLPQVLHVRLVAPFDQRVLHASVHYQLGHKEAEAFVRHSDHERAAYVHSNFQTSIARPDAYDLVLNTARLGFEGTARTIVHAVHERVRAARA